MNTKEAIKFLKYEIKLFPHKAETLPASLEIYKIAERIEEIIELLQRGEIDRKIIEKMKNEKYDVWISLPGSFTNIPKFVRDVEKEVIK